MKNVSGMQLSILGCYSLFATNAAEHQIYLVTE
jgi:hypothetical protein